MELGNDYSNPASRKRSHKEILDDMMDNLNNLLIGHERAKDISKDINYEEQMAHKKHEHEMAKAQKSNSVRS